MRTILTIALIILFVPFFSSGQKNKSYLKVYKYGTTKEKRIKSEMFVDVTINDEKETYSGYLMGISDSILLITYDYHKQLIRTDSSQTVVTYSRTDMEDASTIQLNLSSVDYISHETQTGFISASLGAASLLTTLVIAPLVSYRFKDGVFNSERYLNIMKFSLPATIVGFTLYYSFGSKKYSVRPMN